MLEAAAIEDLLFEIARTLDYCRGDPLFPSSIAPKTGATAHLRARLRGGRVDLELLEWKGGKQEVVGGDWYDLPLLLRRLAERIGSAEGEVRRVVGEFSPDNRLTLRAAGAQGALGVWTLDFPSDAASAAARESPESLALADDATGAPASMLDALRELNAWLRERVYPLRPKASIPLKFWRIADPEMLWTALDAWRGHLLAQVDYDETALPPLPEGHATVCTVFGAFEDIDNEGLATAIENLGPEYIDALAPALRRIGAEELAGLFTSAWAMHAAGASADPAFEALATRIHAAIDAAATLQAVHRYVGADPARFEQA